MKPAPYYSGKSGKLVGYVLRVYAGWDKKKTYSKVWKFGKKKYTGRQLRDELARQQFLFEEEIKERIGPEPELKEKISADYTFSEFVDYWLKTMSNLNSKKRNTINTYRGRLKRVVELIGDKKITEITTVDMIDTMVYLRTRAVSEKTGAALASKTILEYYSLLKEVFGDAAKWKLIPESPMDGIDKPRYKPEKVKALSVADAQRCVEAIQQYAPLGHKVYIMLALLLGMRKGELCGLKWKNADLDKGVIRIEETLLYNSHDGVFEETTKTDSSRRTLCIPSSLVEPLKAMLERRNKFYEDNPQLPVSEFVFVNHETNKPYHPNHYLNWFERFQKQYGLPHCTIHMLRHTKATLSLALGVDLKTVAGELGHNQVSTTTDIYADFLPDVAANWTSKLEAQLGLGK